MIAAPFIPLEYMGRFLTISVTALIVLGILLIVNTAIEPKPERETMSQIISAKTAISKVEIFTSSIDESEQEIERRIVENQAQGYFMHIHSVTPVSGSDEIIISLQYQMPIHIQR